MEFGSQARALPFLTARARLKSRYDITIETDDFIEKGYFVWRDIGNIAPIYKKFEAEIPHDLVVKLPTDCHFVNAVTNKSLNPGTYPNTSRGDSRYDSTGMKDQDDPDASSISAHGSARTSDHYQYGINIPYTIGDGFIKFSTSTLANQIVEISYNALNTDSDGLPLLNDKEVDAIAASLALQEGEKQLFQGKKGADVLVQYLKAESDRLFQAAKIPEKLSDGGIDKILDIKTSWDRKVFGKRFNTIH